MTEVSEEEFEQVKAQAEKETHPPPPPREPLSKLQGISLVIALAVAIGSVLWFLVAALGVKFGVWPFTVGLQMSFQGGLIVTSIAFIVALITLFIQIIKRPRRGAIPAIVLVIFTMLVGGRLGGSIREVQGLPPIHDVQTDWDNPIQFPTAHLEERTANKWNPIRDNPVVPEFAKARWPNSVGRTNAELQEEAYAELNLKPVLVPIGPEATIEAVLEVVEKQGWDVVSVDQAGGLIHATETSFWYGFVDDIAIRIQPQGEVGARVDVRSVSRVGLSDLGANAGRVKVFIDDLSALLHDVHQEKPPESETS